MSERKKPSEIARLRAVSATDAGTIEKIEKITPGENETPSIIEEKVTRWAAETFEGGDVLEAIGPRRWLVKDWLPLDAVGAIVAPAGAGKSFFALSLALEITRGGYFAGEKLEPMSVLYVAAERATDQRDRLEAWQVKHSTKAPRGLRVFAPRRPPQLTEAAQDSIEALCEKVRRDRVKVVILDTFARMTLGLDEISSAKVGPVMDSLDRIRDATKGGLVLIVHHTGHANKDRERGSTAIIGALDFSIVLDGDPTALRAQRKKSNAGRPDVMPEWFRIENVELPPAPGDTDPRNVGVLVPTSPRNAGSNLDEEIVELIVTAFPKGATVAEVVAALEKGGESAVRKRLNALAKSGTLKTWGGPRPKHVFYGPGPLARLAEAAE
jgi:hypothetical protein